MSIPALQANGELPPGEHQASLNEVEAVYGSSTDRRKLLMQGLREAASNFELSGVKTLWIDGSFITDKEEPNDIDGCWEYTLVVDTEKLDPFFLGSREEIANAKVEIKAGIKKNGLLIFYGDEPLLRERMNEKGNNDLRYKSFGNSDKNDIYQTNVQINSGKIMFTINSEKSPSYSINLIGKHNINNALAAISVAKELRIKDEDIITGLENLSLSGMRMQQLKSKGGYLIINDAWNASPNSVQAAIDTFHELSGYNKKILILGDMLELGDKEINYHKEIGRLIVTLDIDFLFTYGELAKYISLEAQKGIGRSRVKAFGDKKSLIEKAKEILKTNDVVLVKGSRGMALEEVVNELL